MAQDTTKMKKAKITKELREQTDIAKRHVEATVEKTRHAAQSAAHKARDIAVETVEKTREVAGAVAEKTRTIPKERIESVTQETEKVAQKTQEGTEIAKERMTATVEKVRGAAHSAAEKTQDLAADAATKTREVVTVVAERAKAEARTGVLKLQILDSNTKRRHTLTELGGRLYDLIKEKTQDAYVDETVNELLQRVKELDQRIADAETEIVRLSERELPEAQPDASSDRSAKPNKPASRQTSPSTKTTGSEDSAKVQPTKRHADGKE
jgi:chromosome segregation ATPase